MLKFAPTIVLAGAVAVLAGSSACAQENKPLTGTIKIDGSSTVGPITTAVAEEFRTEAPEVPHSPRYCQVAPSVSTTVVVPLGPWAHWTDAGTVGCAAVHR